MSLVRIAHISDPHFGTVLPDVRSALVAGLTALRPDLVLITGDITQRARRAQFRDARTFKRELEPLRAFAIPGNHDLPLFNWIERLARPYGGFHRYFQSKREREFQLGPVHVFGLNSTSRWRHVQGRLSLERIRPQLTAPHPTAVVRIVAMHHPLACAQAIDDKNVIKDALPTMRLFEEAKIDLVLSGHVHDPYVALSSQRYEAHRPMILAVAGTCLSRRVRKDAPNSFNLIDIDTTGEPRIALSRFDFDGAGAFRPRKDCARAFRREGLCWTDIPSV